MAENINTPEALEVVRLTLERLMGCSRFYGLVRDGRGKKRGSVTYGSQDTIEIGNYNNDLGAEDRITVKVEGDKVFFRECSDTEWQEMAQEDAVLVKVTARIVDPRRILSNLEDVFVGPFGKNQKVIRAFLNVRALGFPEELIAHIEQGLKIPRPHAMDVDTYSRLQGRGSLRPMVEFYVDRNNLLLIMTVGRIMPGDEDSFTVKFRY